MSHLGDGRGRNGPPQAASKSRTSTPAGIRRHSKEFCLPSLSGDTAADGTPHVPGLDFVLRLDVSDECARKRAFGRKLDPQTGVVYFFNTMTRATMSLGSNPPGCEAAARALRSGLTPPPPGPHQLGPPARMTLVHSPAERA